MFLYPFVAKRAGFLSYLCVYKYFGKWDLIVGFSRTEKAL